MSESAAYPRGDDGGGGGGSALELSLRERAARIREGMRERRRDGRAGARASRCGRGRREAGLRVEASALTESERRSDQLWSVGHSADRQRQSVFSAFF